MSEFKETDIVPRQTGFAISPIKVILLTVACLLGVAVLYSLLHLEMTRYTFGQPVEVPEAAYGKIRCGYWNFITLTVGATGEVSDENGLMSLRGLDYILREETKDLPRNVGWYQDTDENVVRKEYIDDFEVQLRVDAHCPFHKLQKILRIIDQRGIRYACFKVSEE